MQVAKWGNSLAVRLPIKLVEKLGLKSGDELILTATGDLSFEVRKRDKAAEFLKAMEQFAWPLPEDYKFDREEANRRR